MPESAGDSTTAPAPRRPRLSVRAKLIISITLPLLLVAGCVVWFNFHSRRAEAFAETEARVSLLVRDYAGRLDGRFETAAQIARSTAAFLALAGPVTEARCYEMLEANLEQNPLIYGSCIAFEPGVFEGRKRFAPYVHREGAGTRRLDIGADAYDYLQWEWYARPRSLRGPVWTEPYFDEGAGNILMCTYSAPVLIDGTVRGVATIDIPIPHLDEFLERPDLEPSEFLILSPKAMFIASADPSLNGRRTLYDLAAELQRPDMADLARRMTSGASGMIRTIAPKDPRMHWAFFAPIPSTGWSVLVGIPEAEVMGPVWNALIARLGFSLGGIGLMVAILWAVAFWITGPINRLTAGVRRVAAGDLHTRVTGAHSRDAIGELARGFNKMVVDLREQIDAATREAEARASAEAELDAARTIQAALLPVDPPAHDAFELHGVNVPARHVAGDFYDYELDARDALQFVLADVAGKGAGAAMIMAVSRTLIRGLASTGRAPGAVLDGANALLLRDNEHHLFVTAFFGAYDPATGRLRYANAGHNPPLVVAADGTPRFLGRADNPPLGVMGADVIGDYTERELTLAPGEMLLCYTDGVTEARAPDRSFLGEQAFLDTVRDAAGGGAAAVVDAVVRQVEEFQQGHRADDVTLLALRRVPQ
ncbi:MAG: SpoIIE family protein phosphatase [Planctomycetota bacterium]|jgi:sigma-B regulation protein RsbU (phosphoserine phosphatase)